MNADVTALPKTKSNTVRGSFDAVSYATANSLLPQIRATDMSRSSPMSLDIRIIMPMRKAENAKECCFFKMLHLNKIYNTVVNQNVSKGRE